MDEIRFSHQKEDKPLNNVANVSQKRGFLKPQKNTIVTLISVIIFVILIGLIAVFYLKNKTLQSQLNQTSAEVEKNEVQNIIAEVSSLMILPQNERPTVATISDVDQLKGQSFFANAKNGDKVLIYRESKKAILYDPNVKKIVEVAPLTDSQSSVDTKNN